MRKCYAEPYADSFVQHSDSMSGTPDKTNRMSGHSAGNVLVFGSVIDPS